MPTDKQLRKLLGAMRRSSANWKKTDLERLYLGFGFKITSGAKHDRVQHPEYPQLITTLPRHREVLKVYVKIAIELVDQLDLLKQATHENLQQEEDDA